MPKPNYYGLLVGINYIGTDNELRGCVDDIETMTNILLKGGVPKENIKLLSDAYKSEGHAPTKENILNELNRLVKIAKPGDIIFFHYSGHGTNSIRKVNDYEAICALKKGEIELIADFELHKVVQGLVPGAKFVSALDCCHSGDMFNLENNLNETKLTHFDRALKTTDKKSEKETVEEKQSDSKEKDKEKKEKKGILQTLHTLGSLLKPSSTSKISSNLHGYTVVLSGCEIKQTSADTVLDGRSRGAFTACLVAMIDKHGFHDVLDVFLSSSKLAMKGLNDEMIEWLNERGYSQRPDFSFEGQLAPLQKALMVQAKVSSTKTSVSTADMTYKEAKPFLLQFAKFMAENSTGPMVQRVDQPQVVAKNDEQEFQFPLRRKKALK